jgi:hypothetical protein
MKNNTIKYQIAPNPVEDYIYIYMDVANINNVTLHLYNSEGQIVKTMYNLQPSIAYALNVADLPAGSYIVSFDGEGAHVTEKIVKTK